MKVCKLESQTLNTHKKKLQISLYTLILFYRQVLVILYYHARRGKGKGKGKYYFTHITSPNTEITFIYTPNHHGFRLNSLISQTFVSFFIGKVVQFFCLFACLFLVINCFPIHHPRHQRVHLWVPRFELEDHGVHQAQVGEASQDLF